jgi:hypothetical protein
MLDKVKGKRSEKIEEKWLELFALKPAFNNQLFFSAYKTNIENNRETTTSMGA